MHLLPRTNVINLSDYRQSREDAQLNAEWNRLTRLVDEAWTWRDLDALGSARRLHRATPSSAAEGMARREASRVACVTALLVFGQALVMGGGICLSGYGLSRVCCRA